FHIFKERDKGFAALLETGGQFFYVFAMAGNAIIAAPLIAAHGIFSVILSRIFLKEIMSKRQYLMIVIVMIGIIILGFTDASYNLPEASLLSGWCWYFVKSIFPWIPHSSPSISINSLCSLPL